MSRGALTSAALLPADDSKVTIIVNGDPNYDARTTRRAVLLFLSEHRHIRGELRIEQHVQTPIGSGFGASAASAVSAVYATAAASSVKSSKTELALFAHRAEIMEKTGLGTVSVVFDEVGAGAITKAGEPGVSEFLKVEVPAETRIVTAFLAPYDKKDALSSRKMSERITLLGERALRGFVEDPTLTNLAEEGERFSRDLGLESPEVMKLASTEKTAGASFASQNMIGYSVHSLVDVDRASRVARKLTALSSDIRVDVFRVGSRRAGVTRNPSRRRAPWCI